MTLSSNNTAAAFEETRPEKTSVAIGELAARARGRDVAVGEILAALKDRGFGVFMILFALPNAVIPGISFILGAPVVLLALQLAFGREEVWLPEFMRRQNFRRRFSRKALRVSRGFWFGSRSDRCLAGARSSQGPASGSLAFTSQLLQRFLMMPIPFGNALPAFGIALMAVGLIEKDGKAAVIGMMLGFLGALYIGIAIAAGIGAFKLALGLF